MQSDLTQSDLAAIAATRIPEQFKASTNLLAMLDAFIDEMTEAQTIAFEDMEKRTLDDATGVALDFIGEIVGLRRPRISSASTSFFHYRDLAVPDLTPTGYSDLATTPYKGGVYSPLIGAAPQAGPGVDGYPMTDTEYRIHIRLQILRRTTSATGDDALQAILMVFPTPLDPIDPTLFTLGAAALVLFGRRVEGQELDRILLDIVREPAGVRLMYAHTDSDTEDAFGWDEIGTPGDPYEGWIDLAVPPAGAGIWATLIPSHPF